jgi:hypothetical protein
MRPGAAIALVGSCAVLFGASYAAAELTQDDDPEEPRTTQPPTEPAANPGRSLAFDGAERLPGLRERPRPKPEPRPAPAPLAPAPATPAPAPATPAPQPQPVSGGVEAPAAPAAPDAGPAPAPDPPPAPPQPAAPPAGGQTDFYDSGG